MLPTIPERYAAPPQEFLEVSSNSALIEAMLDFFLVELRNDSTRKVYLREIRRLATWCRAHRLSLESLTARNIAAYVEGDDRRPKTINTALSAIRSLFDYLGEKGHLPHNPAARVKNRRHTIDERKTQALTKGEVRALFDAIPERKLIDLRDRAIIGVLYYTVCRSGALLKLMRADYMTHGHRRFLLLREKLGREFHAPVAPELSTLLDRYLEAARIEVSYEPLFQSSEQGGQRLTGLPIAPSNLIEMLQRRAQQAGLEGSITPHVFRATGITEFLSAGGKLEDAQLLARHKSILTTQLYDRRKFQDAHGELWRLSLDGKTSR